MNVPEVFFFFLKGEHVHSTERLMDGCPWSISPAQLIERAREEEDDITAVLLLLCTLLLLGAV